MSKRTLFYPKALAAQGTDQVQSLLSYLEHLALAHNMKPRALLTTLFAEFPMQQEPHIPALLKQCRVHGVAALGAELKERLELATGVSLAGATLDKFKGIFAGTSLTRLGSAYCPCCVQQGDGLPYVRLLWQVQCVTACPVHKVKLRPMTECGATSCAKLPIQKRPSLGGVCMQCGSVGFRCITEHAQLATAEEVWVAEQVARLIAMPATASLSAESLRAGLLALVNDVYGGSVVRASTDAGLARASVCTWVKGATPGLPWLLQLCFHAGADIVALVCGSIRLLDDRSTAGRKHDVVPRSYTLAPVEEAEVREQLLKAAEEERPPSIQEFARQHGMHVDTPRKRFGNEARVLLLARQRFLGKEREEQYSKAVQMYTRAAHNLREQGKGVHVTCPLPPYQLN
jgi:plasmid stability protein